MAQFNVDAGSAFKASTKVLAAAAGFGLADAVLFKGAITPEFIKPLFGWIVCSGGAIVAWRLAK